MNTQPATSVSSASPDGVKGWHDLDWAKIQISVRKTQLKIAQATMAGDWRRVKPPTTVTDPFVLWSLFGCKTGD